MKRYLGIELGSTRIKAVLVDEDCKLVGKGEYGWKSEYAGGVWTYSLDEALAGVNVALAGALEGVDKTAVSAVGISGMMHGYLAFDKDWKLLTPFRTWQCTVTEQAASELTREFGFNIPQRWSIAHLYQAILNGEEHVKRVAHITTLAGYIHYMLTGVNAVGIGEASGMFPIDGATRAYDKKMIEKCDALFKAKGMPYKALDVLPTPLVAGSDAGALVNPQLIGGLLEKGVRFAPPEGDVQTGMVATNSVSVGRGNISAGTSVFLTAVTGRGLEGVYPEVDIVTGPLGDTSVMIHANNCTNDINAWFRVLKEQAELFAGDTDEFYKKLFELSLEGDPDCGGVVVYNYMAGEPITHVLDGRPLVVRTPDCNFTLANFVRAQLFGALATVRVGLEILAGENIEMKRVTAHGGFYKTPAVGQLYTSAAIGTPVYCNASAGEGGPYGMALLAAFLDADVGLQAFLDGIFADNGATAVTADASTKQGFDKFMERFKMGLEAQTASAKINQ